MTISTKLKTLASTLSRDGLAGTVRRIGKSSRMRWYRHQGQNLNLKKSWRSKRPILVIESDDWGAEHIPSAEALKAMQGSNSVSNFDGLETAEDVDRLCNVLSSYKDDYGKDAVITTNFVMANPDYSATKQVNYATFKAKPIKSGWNHEPDAEALWRSYREGIKCGVIVPQLHGILHFCPDEWLQRLQQEDTISLKVFELQMIGEGEDSAGLGLQSMAPIYHASEEVIEQLISEGIETFRTCFNMDSFTTIAPCYGWSSPETEKALISHGVGAMQGREYQHLPNGGIKLHYMGERSGDGMLYMVRNCHLEPVVNGTAAEQCVAEIAKSFELGLPAIVCSHRINYTSRVTMETRNKGLAVLDGVLKQVTSKYPNVEFLSSDKLALRILAENHNM